MNIRRRELLLGGVSALALSPADARMRLALMDGGVSLPRYPNFPKTSIWPLRSTADMYSTPAATTTITDTPTGGGVRITATTTLKTMAIALPGAPVNVTGGNVKFWFRCAGSMTNVSVFRMRLFSAGSPAGGDTGNSLSLKGGPTLYRTSGWQYWGDSVDNLNTVGTGATKSAITWMLIAVQMSSGTLDMDFSDVYFQPNPRTKAAVVFRFDDASPTGYSWLYSTLSAAGLLGPMFNGGAVASAQGFDGFGRVTTAQANTMLAGNAQFMSQAWTTEAVPGDGSAAAFDAQYAGMKAWTQAKGEKWMGGFADGSFYSSVGGSNETARQAMVRAGLRTIQRFDNGNPTNPPWAVGTNFPFQDELNIMALNVASPGGAGVNIPTYVGYALTQAKQTNGVLIVAGHDDWGDANVQTAVNNIITDAMAGNIEIHTFNSLLNPYLLTYGAAPSRY
jgi:hypothetical protein